MPLLGREPELKEPPGGSSRAGRILGGTEEAGRHIGYLTKYLTKSVSQAAGLADNPNERQREHRRRLLAELERTPCSPHCPSGRDGGAPGGVRTHTGTLLRGLPLPVGLRGRRRRV